MSDMPTLANGAAPTEAPAADPGDFGPPIERAAPKPPATERPSFAQQRQAQDQAAADKANPPAADPQQPAPPAGEKHKIGKFEVSEQEIETMMQRQALDDLRKATVPPTPQDYKLAIPETMTLPGDQKFVFDEIGNKAAFDAARAWAHGKGMTQSDFSEMLGLYASQEAQQHAALAERSRQEIAKAGVNAPQRVDAVNKWLTATFGEADAAPLKATNVTDAHLRAWETVITKLTNQGGAAFSQSHRVPPDANNIPNFENMSFAQRRQAQDDLAARRGGR
jgi:hypothetical protein